jgi:hypothetical protein
MDNFPKCQFCKKHFTQHVPTLQCTTCKCFTHISCLPFLTEEEIQIAKLPENHWSCPPCIANFFPFHNISDTRDFLNTLESNDPIPLEHLENLLFNVLDPTYDDGDQEDLDPDEGFFSLQNQTTSNCSYIYPNPLAKIISDWDSPPNISLFHLNAHSLKRNFNEIGTLLHSIDHTFSIMGFTETWLKPHNAQIHNIDGYSHEFLTRPNRPGGGVSMFIDNNLSYQSRSDLNYQDDDVEMLWVEVEGRDLKTTTNLIFGTIYRRPG